MSVPEKIPIFHITHIHNLDAILNQGGLWSKRQMDQRKVQHTSIAYEHIQDRRDTRWVGCKPDGDLHDYVPFYFAPRSPMLYTISRGNVPGRRQHEIIYLVSTVQAVVEAELPYVFTDRHGVLAYASFYNDVADLDKVDWQIMKATYWANTQQDPDRKSRRSAEFLVHTSFPWHLITEIGVMRASMVDQIEEILAVSKGHKPVVNHCQKWYY